MLMPSFCKMAVPFLFLLPFVTGLDAQNGEYQGRLWSITGNGAADTSYLYGTIHIMDEKAYRFPDGTMEAFRSSEAYVMELNMDSVNQFRLMQLMMMEDSTTLEDLLSDSAYADLTSYLNDSLGTPLGPLGRLHPMVLMGRIQMQSFDQDSAHPLDLYFHMKAKEMGKPTVGLESVEEQVEAFQSIPYEAAAQQLVELAREGHKEEEGRMRELLNVYVEGNLDKLLGLSREQKISEDFEEIFLTERNQRMAERATSQIREQSSFIAIGAAHLPGEEGMIELLRAKGFKVESISGDG